MTESNSQENFEQKFQEELCWCIDYLQTNLQTKKLSEKQSKEMTKTISTLKNPKTSLVKKRQLMRVSCGDYRAKMSKEDKEFKLSEYQIIVLFNRGIYFAKKVQKCPRR